MSHPPFSIATAFAPPTAHLFAAGEFDLCAAAPLSEALSEAVAAGCREFHVDLGSVTFIDGSCLDVFLSLARRLRIEGGQILFDAASTCVHRIFKLAGAGALLGLTAVPPQGNREAF